MASSGLSLLALVLLLLLLENHHGVKLISRNVLKTNSDSEFQCVPSAYRTLEQEPEGSVLRLVQFVQWAVITSAAVLGCIRTQTRLAQLVAPQSPMDEIA
jgi:hypothetical protein